MSVLISLTVSLLERVLCLLSGSLLFPLSPLFLTLSFFFWGGGLSVSALFLSLPLPLSLCFFLYFSVSLPLSSLVVSGLIRPSFLYRGVAMGLLLRAVGVKHPSGIRLNDITHTH